MEKFHTPLRAKAYLRRFMLSRNVGPVGCVYARVARAIVSTIVGTVNNCVFVDLILTRPFVSIRYTFSPS